MMRFVESQYATPADSDINLIHAAGALLDRPIGRQRQTEEPQQQCAVHAIVTYEHDRILGMLPENEPQGVGSTGGKVL